MAMQSQLLSSFASNVQHRVLFLCPSPTLTIRSQNQKTSDSESSSSSSSSSTSKPGVGFGSGNGSGSGSSKRKQKQKGGSRERERASIIRRSPVEKPAFVAEQEEADKEQSTNESAFLLAWLGFGALILIEGIALAASGFLPEEWDKFFVKYLYPSFTPAVFLFFAGAVAYGVFKYLQNEKITQQK